jgi:hypothetical protein
MAALQLTCHIKVLLGELVSFKSGLVVNTVSLVDSVKTDYMFYARGYNPAFV